VNTTASILVVYLPSDYFNSHDTIKSKRSFPSDLDSNMLNFCPSDCVDLTRLFLWIVAGEEMIELPTDNSRVVPEDPRTQHGVSEYVSPNQW